MSRWQIPRPWTKKRGSRTLATATGSLVTETIYYTSVMMAGVFGLSLVLALVLAPSKVPRLPPMPGSAGSPALGTPVAAWTFGTLFVAAIVVGGGRLAYRLIWRSASLEFRRVLADRAAKVGRGQMDWPDAPGNSHAGDDPVHRAEPSATLPAVPDVRSINNSPGERLRYRLAPGGIADGVAGQIALSMVWNVVWFMLAGIAVSGLIRGVWRPFLIGLLVPLGAIGWWLFRRMLSVIRSTAGVGPTVVEISDHPLHPGANYRVYVCRWGRMQLRRLTVRLVCEEETFYRQGTDVRRECHRVATIPLGERTNLRVDRHQAAEQHYDVVLPADVMHSVAGSHNAIRWRIEVEGKMRPWPSYCRNFPVVVHPPLDPNRTVETSMSAGSRATERTDPRPQPK